MCSVVDNHSREILYNRTVHPSTYPMCGYTLKMLSVSLVSSIKWCIDLSMDIPISFSGNPTGNVFMTQLWTYYKDYLNDQYASCKFVSFIVAICAYLKLNGTSFKLAIDRRYPKI